MNLNTYHLSYPLHLYCLAKLFHLNPKDYKTARILELGTGSGGNIIPFAYYFQEAQVVGIDISAEKIAIGQGIIDTLQLKNIQLLEQSILDIPLSLGKFDYIICHDLYSGTAENVRNKLMTICRDHLAPEGIVYIGYKTLPAWNMLQGLRDMMLYHVAHLKTWQDKAQQARLLLNFLLEGIGNDNTTHAKFLKKEIQLLSQQSDAFIYHEYLSQVNYACYFSQFVQHANANQLTYLSDAYLPMMFPGNLTEKFRAQIATLKDIVQVGQYLDFIRNQRFRSTVLCHQDKKINRNIDVQHIHTFYIAYGGIYNKNITEANLTEGQLLEFEVKNSGIKLSLTTALSKRAMKILHDERGKPISYGLLIEKIAKQTGAGPEKIALLFNNELNLARLLFADLIKIYPDEGAYTNTIGEYPKANSFIRYMAKISDHVPNARHETYLLNPIEREVLQDLTGEKTVAQILEKIQTLMKNKIQNKALILKDAQGQEVIEENLIDQTLEKMSKEFLENLAQQAYLS